MMTRTYEPRRRPRRAGILPVVLLAGGLVAGGTGAGFELAAPSPVTAVHEAAPASAPWPQPGQPGGGPVTSTTAAPSAAKHSHTILRMVGRMALGHVIRHAFRLPRLHLTPWWLRSGKRWF